MRQFPFGTTTHLGLFTQCFPTYPILAELAYAALQNGHCLCANHAFCFFTHCRYCTPAVLFAKS